MSSRPGAVEADDAPSEISQWVEIGKISGVFGVKGWVKVHSFTRPRLGIMDYNPWYLRESGQWVPRELLAGRAHGGGLVARVSGSDTRDDAEQLIGASIAVPASALQRSDPDEFFWRELIGLRVENTEGVDFGMVSELMETGANDVLVVQGERTRLVPFTRDAVLAVDLKAKVIKVRWDGDF